MTTRGDSPRILSACLPTTNSLNASTTSPADTEALLHGLAQPHPDTSSSLNNDWLIDELDQLQHEQQRRSHLPTDAAKAEQRLRRPAASIESEIPAPDIGPEIVDRNDATGPEADL